VEVAEPVATPVVPALEELEEEAGPGKRSVVDSSVRVDVELLDSLVQLVGELVLTRNQILQRVDTLADADLLRATQRLNLVASELQEGVMKTRMQPIGQVWAKMPRIVRDLAHQLGRKVNLEMDGHDTELDRSLLEALKGPLTHLVRNALDHGLETPDQRLAQGKPAEGRLVLRAYHESGQVVVEISDDGRGIDIDRVGAIAVERGVVSADELRRMDPREVQGLIFRPGFSTATEVTNVSGRGVGMDVVRTNIERIGGSVDINSQMGQGTTCRVRIPLTLAIIPALLVGEAEESYAIPQANLVELVRLEGEDLARSVEHLAGAPVLRLRGHLLPLVSLAGALDVEAPASESLTIVVLQADDIRFGLTVREVHDTQEIVVKPIGRQLKGLAIYAGATIMGDGRVSLILDVAGLAQAHGIDASVPVVAETKVADDDVSALLVLEACPGRRAALPLREISRLEEFPVAQVERSGLSEVVQYRDGILPLVRLAPAIGLDEVATERDQLSVVVHEAGDRRVGIVIDRVLDVVETTVTRSDVGRRPGVLGSAVVQDHVTDLVDLDAVVALAGVGA
jgi:two-component system chemotaxis sensor kinase CheA